MKTALRALLWFLVVLWLGGVLFFPIVAASAFGSLPDTHAAGTVVAHCLRVLHYEGLFSGAAIIVLLLAAQSIKAFPRSVAAPVVIVLIMLGLTAWSQFSIIPRMETHRLAAGGAIDAVPPANPDRSAFNQLHRLSEKAEEAVLLGGLILITLLAANFPRTPAPPSRQTPPS
jgi:hypothetical protein